MSVVSRRWLVVCMLAAGVSGACDKVAPSGLAGGVAGTWSGRIESDAAGIGAMSVTVDDRLVGTWHATFSTEERQGTLSGSMNGVALSAFFTPADRVQCGSGASLNGTMALTGAVVDGRMTGSYVRFLCNGAEGGRIDLTRKRD